jgi:DNA-binding transcriptional LysR family regulator
VPDVMVSADLAAGRLMEMLPQHRPPALPVHAVMPGNRLVPPRVRVLLDALETLRVLESPATAPARARRSPRTR